MAHTFRFGLPAALFLLWASLTEAHHSFAVFDQTRTIELRAVVVDFKLRSPHSSLVVDALAFSDGVAGRVGVERWEIESLSVPILRTMGIDVDTFKQGDSLTIVAWPHRDASFRFGHAVAIIAADGTTYSRGSSDRVYSQSLRDGPYRCDDCPPIEQELTAAPAETSGVGRLQGLWQQPFTLFQPGSALPLNEAGLAARQGYDPKRSPANACEPETVPSVFTAPFYLFDLRIDERQAVLHNELHGDIPRVVPLDGEPVKADPDGQFGIVSGRIEGETLVIESRDYPPSGWGLASAAVFGGGADVPSSERKVLTERFSVNEDGRTLVYEFSLHDPIYLREPYNGRIELVRVPTGTQMYPYECDLESAGMWSRDEVDAPLRVEDTEE